VTRLFAATAVVLALAASALAQPSDVFERGVSALEGGDPVLAERLLRDAWEREPSDRVQLNLADAVLRQGRAREALVLLRPLATGATDLILRDVARDLETSARARVASLRVRLVGFDDDVLMELDGERRAPSQRLELDPGEHRVEVLDPRGRSLERRSITLRPGAAETLSIRPEARGVDLEPRADERRRRRIGLGVAGAVVVTAVVAAIAASRSGSSVSRVQGNVDPVDLRGMP